ncbi:hypothetical protein CWE08_07405 [Aliidiomarina iranensis]|uniref:Uncharacterized protein n=1 Tax=Aliidiomarina iranensis TaxID=1434071 RepID=A0A432VWE0_9GAMM|nr:hypothetical protein CWE08_07405 [Aliidiomarina iranensis]
MLCRPAPFTSRGGGFSFAYDKAFLTSAYRLQIERKAQQQNKREVNEINQQNRCYQRSKIDPPTSG